MRNIWILIFVFSIFSCKKDSFFNPYDDPSLDPPYINDTNYFPNAINFSSIHNNIFAPTCANSGCHDGTFEPDFRTIESSYNTLIYQPVIKNDSINSYEFRVKPGDANSSVLYKRLIEDIDGLSGIMPLTAEYHPEHYWYDHKEEYIQNIKDWIDNGAADMFGNYPVEPNYIPEFRGMIAYATGQSNLLPRNGSRGTIYVSSTISSIDLWFSVLDDKLIANQLGHNQIKFSSNLLNFENQTPYPLEIINPPLSETGFYLFTTDDFYHKYTLDVSNYNSGDIVFIKIYVQDDVNPITEIPSNGSEYQIIKHFSLTIQ